MAHEAFELVRKHHLFAGLSDEQLRRLDLQAYRCVVDEGETLVREGAYGSDLFIIESGAVEILRSSGNGAQQHCIANLTSGANFGELALLDNGPRSATVRATERSELIVIETGVLGHLDRPLEREHAGIFRNLAQMLSQRLRGTNNVTVAALERELELAQMRVEMANFCAAIILILCGYGFVIRSTAGISDDLATTSLLSIPLLLAFAGIVLWLMRRSPYPWSAYGLTARGWKHHLVEAIVWTLPIMALATFIKWMLIRSSPEFAGEPLFNLGANVRVEGENAAMLGIAMTLAYALIVPLQELTARGALQSSLHMFLVGKHREWMAILVSNVVFTACHLHLSTGFALMAFFPGLIWGALYARQRSLIGVSVSHTLLGVWAFSVLGVEAVLPI